MQGDLTSNLTKAGQRYVIIMTFTAVRCNDNGRSPAVRCALHNVPWYCLNLCIFLTV